MQIIRFVSDIYWTGVLIPETIVIQFILFIIRELK